MNFCQTCKFWGGGLSTQAVAIHVDYPDDGYEYGKCDNDFLDSDHEVTDVLGIRHFKAGMSTMSYGEHGAISADHIYTGPDFGCVHHEEKEND